MLPMVVVGKEFSVTMESSMICMRTVFIHNQTLVSVSCDWLKCCFSILQDKGISGQIPESIGGLQSLRSLYFILHTHTKKQSSNLSTQSFISFTFPWIFFQDLGSYFEMIFVFLKCIVLYQTITSLDKFHIPLAICLNFSFCTCLSLSTSFHCITKSTLPPSFTLLHFLFLVSNLKYNRLSGTIPKSLASISTLNVLYLILNCFFFCFQFEFCFWFTFWYHF
jgi:hypothetical protein